MDPRLHSRLFLWLTLLKLESESDTIRASNGLNVTVPRRRPLINSKSLS